MRTGDNCLSSDQSYESIASLGSSSVFDVNKGDVSKVLEFIKTSMDNNQVNLLSVNIPQGQSIQSPKKLNIDESIKSLTVSVSGVNPTIDVVSPVGKTMDEAQGLLTDLDLKNVKIVNILVSDFDRINYCFLFYCMILMLLDFVLQTRVEIKLKSYVYLRNPRPVNGHYT